MDQAAESSSSPFVALAGLNVVIEDESDYVFVAGDLLDDDDLANGEWDDEEWSYDRCDLSPTLSCATSVATNVTLKDLNLIEEPPAMGVVEPGPEARDEQDHRKASIDSFEREVRPFALANPKNGRRLSNKKLRKKVKMMKKAAAAKAAAEAFAHQKAALPSDPSGPSPSEAPVVAAGGPKRSSSRGKPSSPKRNRSSRGHSGNNIAVACAQESLAAYREEVEAGKAQKKAARVAVV